MDSRTTPSLTNRETLRGPTTTSVCKRKEESTALTGGQWTLKTQVVAVDNDNFCFSEENSSLADHPVSEQQLSNESLKEKIRSIPNHNSESQKLLKTSIFQMPAAQYPTKCLILNIYKIKQPQYEVRWSLV